MSGIDAQMVRIVRLGRFKLYYANSRVFTHPGLYVWTGSDHIRVLPVPRRPL